MTNWVAVIAVVVIAVVMVSVVVDVSGFDVVNGVYNASFWFIDCRGVLNVISFCC